MPRSKPRRLTRPLKLALERARVMLKAAIMGIEDVVAELATPSDGNLNKILKQVSTVSVELRTAVELFRADEPDAAPVESLPLNTQPCQGCVRRFKAENPKAAYPRSCPQCKHGPCADPDYHDKPD